MTIKELEKELLKSNPKKFLKFSLFCATIQTRNVGGIDEKNR